MAKKKHRKRGKIKWNPFTEGPPLGECVSVDVVGLKGKTLVGPPQQPGEEAYLQAFIRVLGHMPYFMIVVSGDRWQYATYRGDTTPAGLVGFWYVANRPPRHKITKAMRDVIFTSARQRLGLET